MSGLIKACLNDRGTVQCKKDELNNLTKNGTIIPAIAGTNLEGKGSEGEKVLLDE